jgi:hypothetical protein
MKMIEDGLGQLDRQVKDSYLKLKTRREEIRKEFDKLKNIENELARANRVHPLNPVAIRFWENKRNDSLKILEILANEGERELKAFFGTCSSSLDDARDQSSRVKRNFLAAGLPFDGDDFFANSELTSFLKDEEITKLSRLIYRSSPWASVPLTLSTFRAWVDEGLKLKVFSNYASLHNGTNFRTLQIVDDLVFAKTNRPSGLAPGRILRAAKGIGTALTLAELFNDRLKIAQFASEFHELWSTVLGRDLYNIYFRELVDAAIGGFSDEYFFKGSVAAGANIGAAAYAGGKAATACLIALAPTGLGALAVAGTCFVVTTGVGIVAGAVAQNVAEEAFNRLDIGDEEQFATMLNSVLEMGYRRMQLENSQNS